MLFTELAQICTHLLDIDRSGAELGPGVLIGGVQISAKFRFHEFQ